MELHCPHKRVVRSESILGVVSDFHEDGTPCTLLNVFTVSNDDILAEMIKQGPESESEWKAILSVQMPKTLQALWNAVSEMDKKELIDFLTMLIQAYDSFKNSDNYYKTIIEAFGRTMSDNIHLLDGSKDYSGLVRGRTRYLPCYDLVADRAPDEHKVLLAKRNKIRKDAVDAAKRRLTHDRSANNY